MSVDPADIRKWGVGVRKREWGFVIEADADALKRMYKVVRFRNFEIHCDEPQHPLGGEDRYPPPLAYIAGGIGTRLLTQLSQYGAHFAVPITRARVHVVMHFYRHGSVLQQTIETGCTEVETHLQVESPRPARRSPMSFGSPRRGAMRKT